MPYFITLKDYLLFPVYLFILYKLAFILFRKIGGGEENRRYFFYGLVAKIIGGLFIGFIYCYYYRTGDTDLYFKGSIKYNQLLFTHPIEYFRIMTHFDLSLAAKHLSVEAYDKEWVDTSTLLMYMLVSFFGLLTFNTYLNITLCFVLLSFLSTWFLFTTISTLYPTIRKWIFLCLFFTPTAMVWSASVFKDSFTLSFLLVIFALLLRIVFIKKRFSWLYLPLLLLLVLGIYVLKIYILLGFIPFALLFVVQTLVRKIKEPILRYSVLPILLSLLVYVVVKNQDKISAQMQLYAFETIKSRIAMTYTYVGTTGTSEAAYDLGAIDFSSWSGILKKIPAAINVTLFRPYPWESRKLIIFISAVESFLIMLLTLFVFFRVGIIRAFVQIFNDRLLIFMFGFTLFFSFMTGISTGNFGSLVRYKLPAIPFFMIALTLLYFKGRKEKEITPS